MTAIRATEPSALTREQVRRAPKVLLHDHLDGGLRPADVAGARRRAAGTSCPADDAESLGRWFAESADSGSLVRYLETFDHTVGGDADRPGAHPGGPRVRGGPGRGRRGVRRGPLRPRAARRAGPDPRRGRRRRPARASRQGMAAAGGRIVVRQLLTAMRHQARSMEIAELAVAWRDRGVAGFDIAGAEAGYPPTRHLDAFEYLQRENSHFTIHAGEAFGLPSIWEAIQWCGADRLGHGVRIIDDITVDDDGTVAPRPARGVRPRQADPARDVPGLQRPDRRRRLDRRAPDRAADRAALPGHGQHRQPADEPDLDDRRDVRAGRGVRLRRSTTCGGSRSTR